jgi:hypothetical protein
LIPYLGGFFTGEGHLYLSRDKCRVMVRLRDDDLPLLEAFIAGTGLGSIYLTPAYRSSRPAAAWVIYRRDQLKPAVDLLDRAGLRGRKLREFEVWREAALEFHKARAQRSRRIIDRAVTDLAEARTYRAPIAGAIQTNPRQERRRAYLEVLRQAAYVTVGPLTAATYAKVRATHPDWPTRNTIASAFGSWAAALAAAGLGARCSTRARSKAAENPRDYTDGELAKRHDARLNVLHTVPRLAADRHDRPPTVQDYLAHRAANEPTLPSLNRLYNLFPGGWRSVLKESRNHTPNPGGLTRV